MPSSTSSSSRSRSQDRDKTATTSMPTSSTTPDPSKTSVVCNIDNETALARPVLARERTQQSTLYPKIFKLTDFLYNIRALPEYSIGSGNITVPLIGSTKLHGTHADIVFASATSGEDEIRLQSRNQVDLKAGSADNAGFAAWFGSLKGGRSAISELRDKIVRRYLDLNRDACIEGEIIIAAEWCGSGIQKKVAISKVPRFMAIISIFVNGSWVLDQDYADIEDTENRIFNIGKAGFFQHELHLDREGLKESERKITTLTDQVENECPFAKQVLEESGMGEGIVWKAVNHHGDPKFWFKSKGDQHSVSNVSKLPASEVDKENRERVENFAKAIVTENRLEQGWDLLNKKEMAGLGLFLKWITEDCLVEEKREMEALEISKKKLSPAIVSIARPWFLKRLTEEKLAGLSIQ